LVSLEGEVELADSAAKRSLNGSSAGNDIGRSAEGERAKLERRGGFAPSVASVGSWPAGRAALSLGGPDMGGDGRGDGDARAATDGTAAGAEERLGSVGGRTEDCEV
jgi:hypothetical protein